MNAHVLAAVFKEAYENPHTDFYRRLYAAHGFTPSIDFPVDVGAWSAIPFLTKEDLAATPVEERTFVPQNDVRFYRTSSGTSNRGVVITPRNFVPDRSYQAPYSDRFLEFMVPHHFPSISAARAGIRMIGGDGGDLPATAKLASLFEVDGIGGSVSLVAAFIPDLERTYDLARIRYVFLWGERISPVKRDLFYRSFPNALVAVDYSLSEVHGVGGSACEEMMRAKALYVHPRSDLIYWELIDPDTGTPADEGEIVLTTLWSNNAFPALRYRTGDLARRVAFPCTCGLESYEILGRVAYDRAHFAGGLITSEELERSLALYRDIIEDDFQLHLYDERPMPRAELHVRPKKHLRLDGTVVADAVSEMLRLSPTRTLAGAAQNGLCAPLECVLLSEGTAQSKKHVRIVAH
jgi:phenylacetate-coenzyme A ligase PaaK-like adenylate-forming protein